MICCSDYQPPVRGLRVSRPVISMADTMTPEWSQVYPGMFNLRPIVWTKSAKRSSHSRGNVARLAGIEPTTLGFGGQYSIH